MPSLVDVPRNDLKAAQAFYNERGHRLTADEYRVLWKSQDDPAGFEEMAEDWNVDEAAGPLDHLLGD